MTTQYPPTLPWPEIPDEAAAALYKTLNDFMMLFESHYFDQIHRYYHEQPRKHLIQPDLFQPTDDNSF